MSGASKVPRVVLVTRHTDFSLLMQRHGTREQARFFLETRNQSIEEAERRHQRFEAALRDVMSAIPLKWRRSKVDRADLDRFVFEPEDIVVAVGQDGLVANTAKYLTEQLVIGINPDPESYDGILVPHDPSATARLLAGAVSRQIDIETRTLVEAEVDNGQRLVALNEVFVGHRTHQSARYRLSHRSAEERQSSSGVIVSTGTGATGWARSIHRNRQTNVELPRPGESRLVFFVREAFPSRATGTDLMDGSIREQETLQVVSEMNEDGVIFGDGIEDDRIEFCWGMRAHIRVAKPRLRLLRE